MAYIRPINESVRDKYKHCDRLLIFTTPSEFPDIQDTAMSRIIHMLLEEEEPYQEDIWVAALAANMPALVVSPGTVGELSAMLNQHLEPERDYNNISLEERERISSFASEIIALSKEYDTAHG